MVFESEEWRRKKSDELYREVSRTGLFAQVLAISPEEWDKLEPTFRKRVLEQGRIIYLRHPAEAPALAAGLKRVRIVSYRLGGLTQREKQRFEYKVFGKRAGRYFYGGLLGRLDGRRLGDGCVLVPDENHGELIKVLEEFGITYEVLTVYLHPGSFQPLPISVKLGNAGETGKLGEIWGNRLETGETGGNWRGNTGETTPQRYAFRKRGIDGGEERTFWMFSVARHLGLAERILASQPCSVLTRSKSFFTFSKTCLACWKKPSS